MLTDAAEIRKEDVPLQASHVEKLASARYVGPGVVSDDQIVAPHRVISKRSADDDQCTQTYGCYNCSWTRVCARNSDNALKEVSRNACPGDRPYCDPKTGSCVVDTMPQCMKPSNVTCFKKEGYFPHPTDCKKFVYCFNYTSLLFECIGQFYYNVFSQRCDNYNCYTTNCNGQSGKKVQHPQTNRYFAYCSGNTPLGFDCCLGDDVVNATSQLCEPNCNGEGLIRDTLNCTRYYKCSWQWINTSRFLVRKLLDCPPGFTFKPEEFQCVPGAPQTDCIQSYI